MTVTNSSSITKEEEKERSTSLTKYLDGLKAKNKNNNISHKIKLQSKILEHPFKQISIGTK